MTTALVLSAGGMFAAWEIGVWKVLSPRFRPDLIVGASAGALNGWAIAGGATADELAASWLDPLMAESTRFGVHRSGFMRSEALHEKARGLWERYEPTIPFALTMVEIPRMRVRLVRDGAITWRHLAATCSVPLGYAPVRINGIRYVDGGLLGALPLWAAEELGATRAIALNCLTTLPFRILRAVLRPRQPSPALEVIRLEPSVKLGSLRDAIFWNAANVERWIAQGERDAETWCSSITM